MKRPNAAGAGVPLLWKRERLKWLRNCPERWNSLNSRHFARSKASSVTRSGVDLPSSLHPGEHTKTESVRQKGESRAGVGLKPWPCGLELSQLKRTYPAEVAFADCTRLWTYRSGFCLEHTCGKVLWYFGILQMNKRGVSAFAARGAEGSVTSNYDSSWTGESCCASADW